MSEAQSGPVAPIGVDLERPSVARVYDYYLGGTANWAIDREFADQLLGKFPILRNIAVANRLFLNRVVRYLVKQGVRQFLDIGAGVPTAGNTHQVADELAKYTGRAPDTHVVYADNEPVAVAHAELLLEREGDLTRHAVINADLRNPDDVWQKALDTGLLDPTRPIALLLIAVLHVHQPGPDGADIGVPSVARLRELLPGGSYLAISHVTAEGIPADMHECLLDIKQMYDSSSSSDVIWREQSDVEALAGDFVPVEPGWTWTTEWHPEETGPNAKSIVLPTPAHSLAWAGLAHKGR